MATAQPSPRPHKTYPMTPAKRAFYGLEPEIGDYNQVDRQLVRVIADLSTEVSRLHDALLYLQPPPFRGSTTIQRPPPSPVRRIEGPAPPSPMVMSPEPELDIIEGEAALLGADQAGSL
mgnify:CR=1 FL=1